MNLKENLEALIKGTVEKLLGNIFSCINNCSFSQIIEKTQDETNKLGLNIVELACSTVEKTFNEQRDKHKVVIKNRGKSRSILTTLGELSLKRTLYFDKEQSKCFFAVDEILKLEKYSRLDKGLQSKLINMATISSYGKASELIDNQVSRQTVHNLVKKVNINNLLTKENANLKKIDNIYIEADEDHIHLNNGKSAEVKLIYVHEGVRKNSARAKLINPKYFVCVSDDVDKFWSDVAYYIQSNYITTNAKIHLSGDGAAWIKYGINIFPNCNYHLDKFHIYKSITGMCFGNKNLRYKIIQALHNKDYHKLCLLYKEQYNFRQKRSERKAISDSMLYLQNNYQAIDLSKKYSCAAEGHISHVLSARMSSRPMGWSVPGAERIAKLRAFYFNGGDFSSIIDNNTKEENEISNYKKWMRTDYIDNGSSSYFKPAKVVGLDGITNGLSTLLRSAVTTKLQY